MPINFPLSSLAHLQNQIRSYFKDIEDFEIRYKAKKVEWVVEEDNIQELFDLIKMK